MDDQQDEGDPRVGEPLPNAGQARVDLDKLVRYALDPTSPAGQHKAHVFRVALGIEQRDADYLREAILRAVPEHAVTGVRPPRRAEERLTWEVRMPITGLNGRELSLITAWEMTEGRPELITVRVAPKRRQPGVD